MSQLSNRNLRNEDTEFFCNGFRKSHFFILIFRLTYNSFGNAVNRLQLHIRNSPPVTLNAQRDTRCIIQYAYRKRHYFCKGNRERTHKLTARIILRNMQSVKVTDITAGLFHGYCTAYAHHQLTAVCIRKCKVYVVCIFLKPQILCFINKEEITFNAFFCNRKIAHNVRVSSMFCRRFTETDKDVVGF